jgi:hypothetical protein
LLKLEILTCLSCKENILRILKEFQIYIQDPNVPFVCTVIKAVGRCVDADLSIADNVMEGIMQLLISTRENDIIRECAVVLRVLLQQQNMETKTCAKILKQLVKLLLIEETNNNSEDTQPNKSNVNRIREPTARASIIWLVGEYQQQLSKVTPDILRMLAKTFIEEQTDTKVQILNLAIKVSLQFPENERLQSLMTYILEMSRYDNDIDFRDRARFMTALMGLAPTTSTSEEDGPQYDEEALGILSSHAKNIMVAPKLPPITLFGSVDVSGMNQFALGSLSSVVGHSAAGYMEIPNWAEVQPDPSVRDAKFIASLEDQNMLNPLGSGHVPVVSRSLDSSDEDDDFKIFGDSSGGKKKKKNKKQKNEDDSSDEEEEGDQDEEEEEGSSDEEEEDDEDAEGSEDEEDEEEDEEEESSEEEEEQQPKRKPVANQSISSSLQRPSSSSQPQQQQQRRRKDSSSDDEGEEDDNGDDLLASLGKSVPKKAPMKASTGSSVSVSSTSKATGTSVASGIRRVQPVLQQHQQQSLLQQQQKNSSKNDLVAYEDDFGLLSMPVKPSTVTAAPAPAPVVAEPPPVKEKGKKSKKDKEAKSAMNSTNASNPSNAISDLLLMDFGDDDLLLGPTMQTANSIPSQNSGQNNLSAMNYPVNNSNNNNNYNNMLHPQPQQQQQQPMPFHQPSQQSSQPLLNMGGQPNMMTSNNQQQQQPQHSLIPAMNNNNPNNNLLNIPSPTNTAATNNISSSFHSNSNDLLQLDSSLPPQQPQQFKEDSLLSLQSLNMNDGKVSNILNAYDQPKSPQSPPVVNASPNPQQTLPAATSAIPTNMNNMMMTAPPQQQHHHQQQQQQPLGPQMMMMKPGGGMMPGQMMPPNNMMNMNNMNNMMGSPPNAHPGAHPAAFLSERPQEDFTEPRSVLNPAMGGGLIVSIAFRKRISSVTYPGATCLFVIIRNGTKDRPLRRVHVGFPNDVRKTTLPDIPVLNPGQEAYLPMEIVLTSLTTKQMKIDIRSDQGAFVGLFTINDWDIMTPFEMKDCTEFEMLREKYKGLRETMKTYPLASLNISSYSDELELLIMNKIRSDLLMFLVQGAGLGELMFAGMIKKGFSDEKILLTILTNE